jgi:hypothetical protein
VIRKFIMIRQIKQDPRKNELIRSLGCPVLVLYLISTPFLCYQSRGFLHVLALEFPDQIRICNPRLPGFACYSITFRLSLCPFLRRTSRTKRLSGSVAHFPEDMAAVSDNPEPKLFIY